MRWLRAAVAGIVLAAMAAVMSLPAIAASAYVSVSETAYSPNPVTINLGDTITWCNDSDIPHSVTSDDGIFNLTLEPGENDCVSFKPTSVATFKYDCRFENMRASFVVRPAPAPTTTTAVAPPPPATSPPPTSPTGAPLAATTTDRRASTSTTRRTSTTVTTNSLSDLAPVEPLAEIVPDHAVLPASGTTTTAAGFAINEVGSDPDRGQTLAVIASAAIVLLGGGYLLYHLRFGRSPS